MKPTLALSMIVRDAEQDLPNCLASAVGIVDEVVIVDTGSSDSTIEIAKHYNARIHSIQWPNNFSDARNRALEAVTADWVLVLDADERLDPNARHAIPQLLAQGEADGYLVTIRNYLNSLQERVWDRPAVPNDGQFDEASSFPAYVEHENVRLFRRATDIYFTGRVHETVGTRIQQIGGVLERADFLIHHFGLAADAETRERKNQSYRELGWQKVRDDPGDAQAHFEIGLMEFDVYQNDQTALDCFATACRLNPQLTVAWFFAGLACLRIGQAAQARAFLLQAERMGHSPVLVKEALGDTFYNEGEFRRANSYYRKAISLGNSSELQSKLGLTEVRLGDLLGGWTRMVRAAVEQPALAANYDRLITTAVWAGDLVAAARSAEQKIANCDAKPEYFLRAASIRRQLQDHSAARALLETGYTRFPGNTRLAECYQEVCASR